MRFAPLLLALAACNLAPKAWVISAPLPGWERVMEEARKQAPCPLSTWGGKIEVMPGPFRCVWVESAAGCAPGDDLIQVMAAPTAAASALAHEACHIGLARCAKDYTEPPAIACAARVKAGL